MIEVIKILASLVGPIIVALITAKVIFSRKSEEVNLDLIKEFHTELVKEKPNKWYIQEVFKQVTRIPLPFEEIKELINNEHFQKTIYIINKYPRLYTFQNGKFDYSFHIKQKSFRRMMILSIRYSTYLFFYFYDDFNYWSYGF